MDFKTALSKLGILIEMYSKTPPKDTTDLEIAMQTYDECWNFTRKILKSRKTEIDLLSSETLWYDYELSSKKPNELVGLVMKDLMPKIIGLKKIIIDEHGQLDNEFKGIDERIKNLEQLVTKLDSRMNFVVDALSKFTDMKNDLKEIVDAHRKAKSRKLGE